MTKVHSLLNGLLPFLDLILLLFLPWLLVLNFVLHFSSSFRHHFLAQLLPLTPLNHAHFMAWQFSIFNT